ncbi:MAG: hypothetical protein QNJ13_13310 [Paracoccaceae bacterium]|nr:hypothetical protein [Paracoccaceae bacterium]
MVEDDDETGSSDTSKSFDQAKAVRSSSEFEKKKLLEESETPKLERHLTPGGEIEREVNRGVSEANRARIKQIEERLRNVRQEKNTARNFNKDRDR